MGILDFFDDAELVRSFGAMTFERGRAYASQGRVLEVQLNAANPRITMVSGRVEGSAGRRYAPTVTLAEDPSGAWIDAHCTCPVVRMCKHAAALMLAVQEEQGSGQGFRDWERRLALVLDELDQAAESSVVDKTPLGLQFELATGRPARFSGLEGVPRTHRGLLRVRPVQ